MGSSHVGSTLPAPGIGRDGAGPGVSQLEGPPGLASSEQSYCQHSERGSHSTTQQYIIAIDLCAWSVLCAMWPNFRPDDLTTRKARKSSSSLGNGSADVMHEKKTHNIELRNFKQYYVKPFCTVYSVLSDPDICLLRMAWICFSQPFAALCCRQAAIVKVYTETSRPLE